MITLLKVIKIEFIMINVWFICIHVYEYIYIYVYHLFEGISYFVFLEGNERAKKICYKQRWYSSEMRIPVNKSEWFHFFSSLLLQCHCSLCCVNSKLCHLFCIIWRFMPLDANARKLSLSLWWIKFRHKFWTRFHLFVTAKVHSNWVFQVIDIRLSFDHVMILDLNVCLLIRSHRKYGEMFDDFFFAWCRKDPSEQ